MNIKHFFPQKLKNYYHLAQAMLANLIYGFPSRKIKVIGVTGTNGKTTTVQMISKILQESGAKVGMVSTINFKLGDKEWTNKTKFTTMGSFSVQKFIKQAVSSGCEYLVLETSSHSLDQYRTWGVRYDTAVITNVTREHLDYHKDMESYRLAKLRLFSGSRNAVVNLDMERPEDYLDCGAKNVYGYSTKIPNPNPPAGGQIPNKIQNPKSKFQTVIAEEIESGIDYSSYQVPSSQAGGQNTKYKIQFPGLFNIENALAAMCVGMAYDINLDIIKEALEKITGVPGRMEHVPNDKNIDIIIDYAVTPDSLEKLYELIGRIKSTHSNSHIISVFGSCGERDRGKRPIMGKIVSECADYVIVTNEDPYGEDPKQIIDEVFAGVLCVNGNKSQAVHKVEKENCWRIMDRRVAIRKALQLARPGDIVVVSGKGSEETMAIGKKRIPWNDKKIIQEELRELESR